MATIARSTGRMAEASLERQIRQRAATQYGLIRRDDARRLGLSDRQILHRVGRGEWIRRSSGVFALDGSLGGTAQDTLAAAWAVGGAAARRSGSWVPEVLDDPPEVPDVVSCRGSGRALHPSELTLHRTDTLPPSDLTIRKGIPVTTVERTLCDLGAVVDLRTLRACVTRALQQRLTHPDRLIRRHLELGGQGRPGSSSLRLVLAEIDADLMLLESDLESALLALIVDAGLPRPVLQHPVELDGRRCRLDMAYPELHIAIEADGFAVHGTRSAFEDDRARQNQLTLAGWQVLRFTWRQVCREPEWVVSQIRTALDRATRQRRRAV